MYHNFVSNLPILLGLWGLHIIWWCVTYKHRKSKPQYTYGKISNKDEAENWLTKNENTTDQKILECKIKLHQWLAENYPPAEVVAQIDSQGMVRSWNHPEPMTHEEFRLVHNRQKSTSNLKQFKTQTI